MKRWWLLIALLLSAGINVGILATLLTQRVHKPAAASAVDPATVLEPRPNLAALADRLGLTGETRSHFIEMQQRFVSGMREQRFHLMQLQAELRSELLSEHPDRERIGQLTKELGETYGGLDRALADNILASREVLTPQQQIQFLRFVGARLQQLRGDRPPAARSPRERLWPFRRRPG